MVIAIVTLYTEIYQSLANCVLPNLKEYCDKHHYHLIPIKIDVLQDNSYGFIKIKELKKVLPDYDVVVSVDIDTLVTNHTINIESFIDNEHDFYITKDVNGINAGVFIIKNTEWGRWFIDLILQQVGIHDNEQNVIESFKDNTGIKIALQPCFNSYPYDEYAPTYGYINATGNEIKPAHNQGNWESGDFLMHLPGLELNKRLEIFTKIKEQIIYE